MDILRVHLHAMFTKDGKPSRPEGRPFLVHKWDGTATPRQGGAAPLACPRPCGPPDHGADVEPAGDPDAECGPLGAGGGQALADNFCWTPGGGL